MNNKTIKFYTWAHKTHFNYKHPALISICDFLKNIREIFKIMKGENYAIL